MNARDMLLSGLFIIFESRDKMSLLRLMNCDRKWKFSKAVFNFNIESYRKKCHSCNRLVQSSILTFCCYFRPSLNAIL
jgi:hypothetical protein